LRKTALVAALLLVLLAGTIPALMAVAEAFTGKAGGPSLEHVRAALADPLGWRSVAWTAGIAAAGAAGAALIGIPFALLTARTDLPGRRFFAALYAAPLVLPPLLMAMAWRRLLAPEGGGPPLLPETPGWKAAQAAGLFALAYFPFVTLFARRSLASVGAAQEEAAALAAGPWRGFLRVTLPLARPGILAGTLFAFVFALNDFSVVDYVNIVATPENTVPAYAYQIQIAFSRKEGSVPQMLVLGLPVALLALGALALALRGALRTPTATVGTAWRPPRPISLRPLGKAAGVLFCGGVLAAGVLVPVVTLAGWAADTGSSTDVFVRGGADEALRLTVGLAAAATLLAVPVALVLAEAARRAGRAAEAAASALVLLPLALTPAVVPIGAIALWNRAALEVPGDPPWNPVYQTEVLAALLVFARVLPFAFAATLASLREVEDSQLEAAEAAGIPWDLRLRRVVLPLASPGVALGAVLAFVFAVRELDGVAVLGTQTIVRKMWAALHTARDDRAAAMAIALIALEAFVFALAALAGFLRPRGQREGEAPPAASARRSSSDS